MRVRVCACKSEREREASPFPERDKKEKKECATFIRYPTLKNASKQRQSSSVDWGGEGGGHEQETRIISHLVGACESESE